MRCDVRALRAVAPLLARVARHVASAERFESSALSIVVVGARTMARLHGEYMNDPTPTDVLTFDLGTSIDRRRLEGEIVVCADVALEHAGRRGVRRELALYVAHGVLHLAGYDDHTPRGYARMHAREDALLEALGLGRPFERGSSRPDGSRAGCRARR